MNSKAAFRSYPGFTSPWHPNPLGLLDTVDAALGDLPPTILQRRGTCAYSLIPDWRHALYNESYVAYRPDQNPTRYGMGDQKIACLEQPGSGQSTPTVYVGLPRIYCRSHTPQFTVQLIIVHIYIIFQFNLFYKLILWWVGKRSQN